MPEVKETKLVGLMDLSKFAETQAFVGLTGQCPQRLELRSNRWVVDAKSIMGIFSLNVAEPVELWAEVDDEEELISLKDMFAQFKA